MKRIKVVYVCHPVAGAVVENLAKIIAICASVHTDSVYPIAPYHTHLQYSKDEDVCARARGMACNLHFISSGFVDEVHLYGPDITRGMKEEIRCALDHGVKVVPKTKETARLLIALCEERNATHLEDVEDM